MKLGRAILILPVAAVAAWWWHERPPEPAFELQTEEHAAEPTTSRSEAEAPISDHARLTQHPLQTHLLTEDGPERDSVLLSMIRDNGLICEEIVHARTLGDETASWRISCDAAHAYLLEVDATGTPRIEPLHYDDRLPPVPVEATRDSNP